MAYKDNVTSYSFGQLGSVYATASQEEINPPSNKVFVAITFLEDTIFDDSGGLVAETTEISVNGTATTPKKYIGTEAAAHDLAAAGETVDEGTGGAIIGGTAEADAVTFPRGITIYGRWTEIDVYSGALIAYIGE